MDPMQLMRMLGAPVPVAQAPVPPAVQGTSPPVISPAFLPQNLSDRVILQGPPQLQAPTPMALPGGIDVGALMAKYADAFKVPQGQNITLPGASQRAAPQFADPTGMMAKMLELAPQDSRRTLGEFESDQFAGAMAKAAAAAAGASNIGELLAGAGSAFAGGMLGAKDERRAEEMAFDEQNRAFQVQMAQLQWDVDQAKAEQANATSDVDFANAQAREERAVQQMQLQMQQQAEQRNALAQQMGLELDLMNYNAGRQDARAQVDFQNKEAARQFANDQVKARQPQYSISEDGNFLTQQYVDPTTGKLVVQREPIGLQGQMEQISRQAAMLGLGGPEYEQQGYYANMARIAPERFKRQVIIDVLRAGGDKIFEPEDAGTDGLFKTGKAKNAEDYFNIGKTITDQLTTSKYEQIRNEVKMHIDDRVEKGLLDPTQSVAAYQNMLAARLEPLFDQAAIKRARALNDPGLNYALDLMK